MDQVRIKLSVSYDGATPASVGWPDLRELLDRAVEALCALGGVSAGEIHVLDVQEGSVVPVLGLPPRAAVAARALARGPSRRWTPEQRRRVEPFYALMRERGATARIGARKLNDVVIPGPTDTYELKEQAELRGKVMRVGGNKGRVRMLFDLEGAVVCDAGREVAAELGKHLYKEVVVTGITTRDAKTLAMLGMTIHQVDPAVRRRSAAQAFRLIDEAVGEAGVGFDVLGAVKESRG